MLLKRIQFNPSGLEGQLAFGENSPTDDGPRVMFTAQIALQTRAQTEQRARGVVTAVTAGSRPEELTQVLVQLLRRNVLDSSSVTHNVLLPPEFEYVQGDSFETQGSRRLGPTTT